MKVYSGNFLRDIVSKLIEDGYKVYGAVKTKDYYVFDEIKSGEEISLEYCNTRKSPKEIVFPENEVLIKYSKWIEEIPIDDSKRAIVGIRPCDAKALTLLDKVFLNDDFKDPYYEARRKNLLLIGYACNEPGEYCFCESLGLSPFGSEGLDILVSDLGDRQVLEAFTEEGHKVLEMLDVKDASEEDIKARDELRDKAVKMFRRKLEVENLREILEKNFESDYWEKIALTCVSCGVCTYLCPTCFCFDILDEGEEEGVRYRAWDSCQFPLYTLESSSHNPRREKWQRLRNRFYDKFYYMVEKTGEIFCVGCGRCIEACPMGIDITEVLNGLREGGESK
ncbi:MAG: 4Fe-4S ferredoxin [Candidatus Methanomethylicota archaeon]|uniref:4Fe-4S ferredoxin n=1 Tax=Thermoproteota archaeon TaxID=2056631 RepID=A0A497EKK4_9CREN|nr:MAG: 4Fe-4S ferredoxin [Candidatus Verstraetearchaeota archaeon]